MKTVLALFLLSAAMAFYCVSCTKPYCGLPSSNVETNWITMAEECVKKVKGQVQEELVAAMTYLSMGAHFSRDVINRPGFAKIFFEMASEEREHAIKLIYYLLVRGELVEDVSSLIQDPQPKFLDEWDDGLTALKKSLELETSVTSKIVDIIKVCEAAQVSGDIKMVNDYNLVEYLSGDFLDEQYKGQRELAGMISTLTKMNATHKDLGEFLFDKKLLNGEPL